MKNKLLYWQNINTINKLLESLKKSEVSVVTTDTVLGLLTDITQDAFKNLNEIKQRNLKSSYIILINSIQKLPNFVEMDINNKKLMNLISNCWPGPVTIVFKSKSSLPFYLKTLDNTIAIRIPNHAGLLQLLTYFDGLFSTSANISGQQIPNNINELNSQIINSVKYIVIDKINKLEKNINLILPSTIIDCTQDKIKVIREGAYEIDKLEKLYNGSNK